MNTPLSDSCKGASTAEEGRVSPYITGVYPYGNNPVFNLGKDISSSVEDHYHHLNTCTFFFSIHARRDALWKKSSGHVLAGNR